MDRFTGNLFPDFFSSGNSVPFKTGGLVTI